MTVDETRLAELEALADAATPGPWEATGNDSGHSKYELDCRVITEAYGDFICDMDGLARQSFKEGPGPDDDGWADATFIAAARTAIPELIAALREARADAINAWQHHADVEAEPIEAEAERDRLAAQIERVKALAETLIQMDDGATVAHRSGIEYPLTDVIDGIRAALDDPEPRRADTGGDE